jgi:hypothetical protein
LSHSFAPDYSEYELDPLDEMFRLEGTFSAKDEKPVRLMAMLQIAAHATTVPELTPPDHALFALLLGRWSASLDDCEFEPTAMEGFLTVPLTSLAHVLRVPEPTLEPSMQRLSAARLIEFRIEDDQADVSIFQVLVALALPLTGLLERDVVDRHGRELRHLGDYYLGSVQEEIEDLKAAKPSDPRVRVLASEYEAFRGRLSVRELMKLWPQNAKRVYAWLEDLAQFQERHAILSGKDSVWLKEELNNLSTTKLKILSERLPTAPMPGAANAA